MVLIEEDQTSPLSPLCKSRHQSHYEYTKGYWSGAGNIQDVFGVSFIPESKEVLKQTNKQPKLALMGGCQKNIGMKELPIAKEG